MRIGLLGGTFDPIHRGHVAVARAARRLGLERVVLVPARRPPHKDGRLIASPFHRFALAALAAAGEEGLTVSPYEVSRAEPSYTVLTVRHFIDMGHSVTLVMGTDSLAEIETWRECDEILERSGILAYPRLPWVGADLASLLPAAVGRRVSGDAHGAPGTVGIMQGTPEDVSSTLIRERIERGLSIGDLVPAAVEEYITKNELYNGRVDPA